MYIELFLLDNLLMNLLIMRLAAALLSVRPPLYRQAAAVAFTACYAALAAYLWPLLGRPFLRPLLLAAMAFGLPVSSFRGFLSAAASVLFSTFAVGGLACCIALAEGGSVSGGFIRGGMGLRTALVIALAASLLPRAARGILRRKLRGRMLAELVITHKGVKRRFAALIDTGCSLREPVTGLPVVTVRCAALRNYCRLPIRAGTVAGECTLYAFRPDSIKVDGAETDALVACAVNPMRAEAIVPPELCGGLGKKQEIETGD